MEESMEKSRVDESRPERENSVFILTCPWGYSEKNPEHKRYKPIKKFVLLDLIRMFWNAADIEPFVVCPDQEMGDFCNLFIQTGGCDDLYETMDITRACWEGNVTFILGNYKYTKRAIYNIVFDIEPNSIVFYMLNTEDEKSNIVAITAHSNTLYSLKSLGILMASSKFPQDHSLNSVYETLKMYREDLWNKRQILLVVRKADATPKY